MRVLVGFGELPGGDGVVAVSDAEEAADVLDRSRGGDVLVISGPGETERTSRMARTAMARGDVGLVVLSGHRTARILVASCLLALPLARYASAPAVAARAAGRVRTRLALSSVSRLGNPAPTLRQHVRGWLPSTAFDVDITAGEVRETRSVVWPVAPADVVVWDASPERRRLTVTLEPARDPDLTLPARPQAPAWRAREWAEASWLDRTPDVVAREILAALPARPCPMCDRPATGPRCIFCGNTGGDDVTAGAADRSETAVTVNSGGAR
ncbi:hypothetical protein FE374_15965 [Georgenia yuyongxinii]|uniref:Uncharacterized protein n=1 Tax=Georgenia yuyongxinii TaxID=2589797 RepID=A0A5B8C6Y4_9MICO|nr:hypothetical protein [Georgenia yuyongxinii]QDC25917.1 hypothetical protein FE374_15965 [Georgenia yuyongxinii]